MLLEVKGVEVYYGKALALQGVSISIPQGEITGIIGPNGAGKTTLLRSVMGLVKISSGAIFFDGKTIDDLPTRNRIKMGIAMSPERRGIFPAMTVLDNLLLGAYVRSGKDNLKNDLETVFDLFPILEDRKKQLAGTLSGGEQKMLTIAKALMAKTKLLMMDDPSASLAPILKAKLTELIKRIRQMGVTILLAEQDAWMTFELASKIYVMEQGRITLHGTCSELRNLDCIRESYLGV